jgi:hypothetical protein
MYQYETKCTANYSSENHSDFRGFTVLKMYILELMENISGSSQNTVFGSKQPRQYDRVQ